MVRERHGGRQARRLWGAEPVTELRAETLSLESAELGPENPLPRFRAKEEHGKYRFAPSFPEEDRKYVGRYTGSRVLPYRMQDGYSRVLRPREVPELVLENEVLRATVVPEVGGKHWSLVHKPSGRELLEANPAIQYANLALRNAWTSGGVEWNCGQLGHHCETSTPVFCSRITGTKGEPALRIHEYDRMKGFLWQVDLHLPPAARFLYAAVRIVNNTPRMLQAYWWTNIAVPELDGARTIAPAEGAFMPEGDAGLGLRPMPRVDGVDVTYPRNIGHASEMFFKVAAGRRPFVTSLDQDGRGLVETSTARLKGRKMFVWGMNPGGRRWQEYLSGAGRSYIEIQAGLARTQMEHLPMPPGAAWTFTEAFGLLEADPATVHGADWGAAVEGASGALGAALPEPELDAAHAAFGSLHGSAPLELLSPGSGWGALEYRRLKAEGRESERLPGVEFSESTMGPAQSPWLELLEKGFMTESGPQDDPGEYMTSPEWEERLAGSGERNWRVLLHRGMMRAERFDYAAAREDFRLSALSRENAWALRNSAQLESMDGHWGTAADLLQQAWKAAPQAIRGHLAVEVIDAMSRSGRKQKAMEFARTLPQWLKGRERVQLAIARLALETGDLDTVESILKGDFATVREGELELGELWYAMWEKRVSAAEGVTVDEALKERVRREHPVPSRLDFRAG